MRENADKLNAISATCPEMGKYEKRMRDIGQCMDELVLKGFINPDSFTLAWRYVVHVSSENWVSIKFRNNYIVIESEKFYYTLKYTDTKWHNKVLQKVDELLLENKDE